MIPEWLEKYFNIISLFVQIILEKKGASRIILAKFSKETRLTTSMYVAGCYTLSSKPW